MRDDPDIPVHDAGAIGCLLWPELFRSVQLAVRVCTDAPVCGKCLPMLRRDIGRKAIAVLTTFGAVDFLKDMLETLRSQRFVV